MIEFELIASLEQAFHNNQHDVHISCELNLQKWHDLCVRPRHSENVKCVQAEQDVISE